MLEKALTDIYMPAFPDEHERESIEKIFSALHGDIPGVSVVINVLGTDLEDPEKRVLKGVSIAYYYEAQSVGLLAYNAVHPDHREKGIGKLMVQSRIESLKQLAADKGRTLEAVFLEVNDPTKVAAENDSMDPQKRVNLFKSWGAEPVPVDYVQPPLEKDGYYVENMMLMNYPLDGKFAGPKEVEKFLRAIYREGRGNTKVEEDYFFLRMKKQLKDWQPAPSSEKDDKPPGYALGVPKFKFS